MTTKRAPRTLGEMQNDAEQYAGDYLRKHEMGIAALDDVEFEAAMGKIMLAIGMAWAAGYAARASERTR